MLSKQNNKTYKRAFDTIVFLGFIALLSVAATKASAWEQKLCEPRATGGKINVKKAGVESKEMLSVREAKH